MKDQFCSYEISLRLKELGFNEPCLGCFTDGELYIEKPEYLLSQEKASYIFKLRNTILAPLWQQATKWLREVYHIHIGIWYNTLTSKYRWERQIGEDFVDANEEFNTYELALSEGLIEALKLIL